jgi:hypothetical protein
MKKINRSELFAGMHRLGVTLAVISFLFVVCRKFLRDYIVKSVASHLRDSMAGKNEIDYGF